MEQRFIDEVGLAHAFSKLKSEIDSKLDPSGLVKKSGDTMTGELIAPKIEISGEDGILINPYDESSYASLGMNTVDPGGVALQYTDQEEYGGHVKMALTAWNGGSDGEETIGLVLSSDFTDTGTLPIMGVSSPIKDTDAANKQYVDNAVSSAKESWYGECSTAAATAAKTVSCSGFTLKTGAQITVRFTEANTAWNPTLNVNGTGAKTIQYKNSALNTAIRAGYLAANGVYTFCYDGAAYEIVGGDMYLVKSSNVELQSLTMTGDQYIDHTAKVGRITTIGYQDGESYSFHINDHDENNDSTISLFLHQSAPVGGVPAMELSAYGLDADEVLIRGVADPVNDTDAANKAYVDAQIQALREEIFG